MPNNGIVVHAISSPEAYLDARWEIIRQLEGTKEGLPYYDHVGVPTIGIETGGKSQPSWDASK